MKYLKIGMGVATGIVAFVMGSVASAALPQENRLGPITDYGAPSVTFEDIDITYRPGKRKKKSEQDATFFAESTNPDGFGILNAAGDQSYFTDGYLKVDARITPQGTLKDGGSFEIWSSDGMFDDGSAKTGFNCNKPGTQCASEGWLVYGGDLFSFGWGTAARDLADGTVADAFWEAGDPGGEGYGVLEFGIWNQSGWAWDEWGSGAFERIIFGIVGGLGIEGLSSVTTFNATARGMAVVPVPAAVWLFGSGLLGLVGIARRKRA